MNTAPVAHQVLDARAHLSRRQASNVTAIPTSSSALSMIIAVITPACTRECNFFISDLAVSLESPWRSLRPLGFMLIERLLVDVRQGIQSVRHCHLRLLLHDPR